MGRRQWRAAVVLALSAALLTACAAGANDVAGTGAQSGFWLGLWHGAISPITFIVSLFRDDISIYEVHNVGHWYDFGFLLGASVAFSGAARSGSAAAPSRARRRRRARGARRTPRD
jgi:hypothetical protein